MTIKSIAVFCGSKAGNNPIYRQHAAQLGKLLAQKKIILIFGGGGKGIMGAVADAVMSNAGKVRGVIPQALIDKEHQHKNITELTVVDDMHIRKKKMYELCDAAIILPGGFGTMDELFEMLTWNQLSIHDKTIFILNSAGFYDHLLQHIFHLEEDGFLYDPVKEIKILNAPEDILPYFE
ncbi:MAG: TIGR00730 family Rossman fold protein [Bacteroidota bacterium]|nr:TIGR00730 family Rossman fold protein [Bacteroidota bacterium]